MSDTVSAKNVTLHELEASFSLELVEDKNFFPEWRTSLPQITDQEQQLLDKVRAGYMNLIRYPPMLENTVQMTIVAPLLYLADFYLPPFHIQSEVSVSVSDMDEDITIEGRIDFLLLHDHLRVVVIESKHASFSVEAGLARLLSYMLANPHPDQLNIGLITTGGSFAFVKLVGGEQPQYALSQVFELRNPGNDLYHVLRILKHFRDLFLEK
ncbi:hypothetical protein QUF80_01120 [Desulfococcaceae bacterium HSG8]|nr:hypothetical protein [Desulfococcaceae bacterium HSG8]